MCACPTATSSPHTRRLDRATEQGRAASRAAAVAHLLAQRAAQGEGGEGAGVDTRLIHVAHVDLHAAVVLGRDQAVGPRAAQGWRGEQRVDCLQHVQQRQRQRPLARRLRLRLAATALLPSCSASGCGCGWLLRRCCPPAAAAALRPSARAAGRAVCRGLRCLPMPNSHGSCAGAHAPLARDVQIDNLALQDRKEAHGGTQKRSALRRQEWRQAAAAAHQGRQPALQAALAAPAAAAVIPLPLGPLRAAPAPIMPHHAARASLEASWPARRPHRRAVMPGAVAPELHAAPPGLPPARRQARRCPPRRSSSWPTLQQLEGMCSGSEAAGRAAGLPRALEQCPARCHALPCSPRT